MKNIVIFISGRGSNMEAILRSISSGVLKGVCSVSCVVSNRADAAGLDTARTYGVKTAVVVSKGVHAAEYNRKLRETVDAFSPDYIVLAGYMKILDSGFVKQYPKRIINIHPADTSAHQGLHAYEWAFENRLKKSYITVHYVDEGVDTGEVIGKAEVDMVGATSLHDYEERGLAVEHRFYSEMLKNIFITENVAR
ncbi:MAG: phosphoribosylglycinamide formyltransferase [Spirochaetes bacterium]|jgi:phosphoribosylglycinamide formyltransferase-1|nr:phosphoribosylglycinamide formyltransferase [Spirochaetota bacterium]